MNRYAEKEQQILFLSQTYLEPRRYAEIVTR